MSPGFRLPNALIHLTAFIRPHLLRPDIKVPHIGYVDFAGLRREGFNAVVVDKDNCVTIPESDHIYDPFRPAWETLLNTFPPGRVLVVSNSAGTPKDPTGIAAEAVSLNLRTPVLVRKTPKPGCASEIISYFRGNLGRPTTLRGRIHDQAERIRDIEKTDEKILLERWIKQIETEPLLGPLQRSNRSSDGLEHRMAAEQASTTASSTTTTPSAEEKLRQPAEQVEEDLRILVVGDRLFTDTLLAHRLSRHLPRSDKRSVLSIHTTLLPRPDDVRFLRWVEEKLSGGRLRSGKVDWGRFTRDPYQGVPRLSEIEALPATTWREKWNDLRGDIRDSRLQWDPRTWTAFDLAVGLGRGVVWVESRSWRLLRNGAEASWKWVKRRSASAQAVAPATQTPAPPAEEIKSNSTVT